MQVQGGSGTLSTAISNRLRVRLLYASRTDTGLESDCQLRVSNKRLSEVFVEANDSANTNNWHLLRRYMLAHAYPTPPNPDARPLRRNMTKREFNINGKRTQTLMWNDANQLKSVSQSGVPTETYWYDANGIRIRKQRGTVNTFYPSRYYELKQNGSTTTATKYYYLGDLRIALRVNGTFTYLHSDHLGSIAATTSGTSVTGTRLYKPYGGKRGGNDYSFEPNYTGQRLDDTGLLYYNARYYDPLLGQFISPDPIIPDPTDVFAYNRYLYANGNPFKYNDPTGHTPDALLPPRQFDISGLPGWGQQVVCFFASCSLGSEGQRVASNDYAAFMPDPTGMSMPIVGLASSADDLVRLGARGIAGLGRNEFVQNTIASADNWVVRNGVQGTTEAVTAAASRGEPVLPGLFRYVDAPNIPGYEKHHLWPQGLGGPRNGWSVYVQKSPDNFHTANPYGIQSAVDHQLMEQTGLNLPQMRGWARDNPAEVLPKLREIYADMEIPFPY